MLAVGGDDLDETGDEVVATLELNFDAAPALAHAVAVGDEAVVEDR